MLASNVSYFSKRISILGLDATNPPPPKVIQLQRAIRMRVSYHMHPYHQSLLLLASSKLGPFFRHYALKPNLPFVRTG